MNRVFFTDRDLGNQFPDILIAAGLTVERHRDHFSHDCADEEWLRVIGRRGWIAITHNSRIRYTPNQLRAVMEHSVALLVVIGHARYACGGNASESLKALPRRLWLLMSYAVISSNGY